MVRWIIGFVVVALVTAATLREVSRSSTFQFFGGLTARVETTEPLVALTLDDGPTPRYAPDVLQLLADKGVKATFFITGEATEKHPELVTAIAEAGHELGNHSYSHSRMVLMRPNKIRDELARTDDAIRATGYTDILHFRPPYGRKLFGLPYVLREQGRQTISWSVEPEYEPDETFDGATIAQRAIEQTTTGDIILMHVMFRSRDGSREALPLIIDRLRERGFRFVTVSELLSHK